MRFTNLKLVMLFLAVAGLVFGQGINTTASPDDWEEINFAFDSSILVDGFPSLLRLAELLNQNPDYKVTLTGHTDYLGSNQYNDALAMRRATAVQEFLLKYGARDSQLTVQAEGETAPEVDSRSDEARYMNRRVVMTVRDADGKIIGAGGVGDAIGALEKLAKAQEECCNAILKKLDKLDEILAALNGLKDENAKLHDEINSLKEAQAGLEKQVAEAPKPPPAATPEQVSQLTREEIENSLDERFKHFSLLGINVGTDDSGDVTWSGSGRYFRPFKENFAVQAGGEFMDWKGRTEGQFDLGLVGRHKSVQVGVFGSVKALTFSQYESAATLAQASVTGDYIFKYGKVGVFGTKGIRERDLLQSIKIGPHVTENTYASTMDQFGGAWTLGLWDRNWFEGNLGYLWSKVGDDKPGGTLRLVFPFAEHWAFTAEGGFNETLVGPDTTGRWALGLRFGNFLEPKRFAEVEHPVPVQVPRVRYELITERDRNGNDAPIARAGPDLIGISAGQVTLDGSASSDPDQDEITFRWIQTAGPSVALSGADTSVATFTADDGQVYAFRLTVTDSLGATDSDAITITTRDAPKVGILRFTAVPTSITRGDSSTLNWQVDNADTVEIDNGVGSVDPVTGTVTVKPTETTVYHLTAKNASTELTQAVQVTVLDQPGPSIVRCDVTPQNINEGETATLNWETYNANDVNLTGFGSVASTGTETVSPATNTTYTLTAANDVGTVSCAVTVQVTRGELPRIIRFGANPLEILEGNASSLFWQVERADEVTIDQGVGSVNNQAGNTNVTPNQTTTYTLTATNAYGTVQAEVTVNVFPAARILTFQATPDTVEKAGDLFILSWGTENADEIVISELGKKEASGSIPLRAFATTTYTIIARNRFSEVQQTVTVTVPGSTPGPGSPPVANAGSDFSTDVRNISLNGSASSDPDGGELRYLWRVVSGEAEIMNPNAVSPMVNLTGPDGVFVFELLVTDSTNLSSTDTVTVQFVKTP